jgi:hypothetical protein
MVTLNIGRGFNSATNQVKPSSVFGSSINPKSQNVNKLYYYSSVYKSSDEYKKKLSGSFKAGMPIPVPNSANLDYALNFANGTQRGSNSLIYVIRIVDIGRKEDFDALSPVLSDPHVQNELKNGPGALAKFYDKYGDSYVTSIYYGKEVAITIEFQNSNQESANKINSALNFGMSNVIKLENIVELEKIIKQNNIRSKINVQSTGFRNSQLPPVLPSSISDLATWLTALQNKLNLFKPEDFTDQLEYETTSYNSILAGAELDVTELSMKALLFSQYFSRIKKCRSAIEEYFNYYEYLGNNEQVLTNLQLYAEKLNFIESILLVNSNLSDVKVANAIKGLRTIIFDLNKLNDQNIAYKVVDKITSTDFGDNITDFNMFTKRYVSPSFKIDVDPKLLPKRFTFKVSNQENKLDGTLGLYYSDYSQVPYDSRSQPVASNIKIGNSTADLPEDLYSRGFKNTFFGYHYEGSTKNGFNIKKPLEIETSINYKIPGDIYIDDTDDIENENNVINKLKLTT